MREIKFRAWLTLSSYDDDDNDKDYHGMATKISVHSGGDIGFDVEEGNKVFGADVFGKALDNGTVSEYEEWCLWEGLFKLMQYTGLKDKNGVDIYEGDILRWSDSDSIDDYQVIYEAPSFKYASLSNPEYIGGKRAFDELEAEKDFEVIGNIYENKDLLND